MRNVRKLIKRLLHLDVLQYRLSELEKENNVLKKQIDTLHYFLNTLHNIKELPPTKDPDLRIMQECDSLLLQIFNKVCIKYGMTYWLDWGTLLGAVRHNGFIPWDDDMDVCMLRNDYEKLYPVLIKEFCDTPFNIIKDVFNEISPKCATRIGFGYKHNVTGIWLDIFPMDEIKADAVDKNSWLRAMSYYSEKDSYQDIYIEGSGKNEYMFCPGDSYNTLPPLKSYIFPLKDHIFEGYKYPVPGEYFNYLENEYHNFMTFPKNGAEKHDQGRGALKYWAKKNNIDMKIIKRELTEFLQKYD